MQIKCFWKTLWLVWQTISSQEYCTHSETVRSNMQSYIIANIFFSIHPIIIQNSEWCREGRSCGTRRRQLNIIRWSYEDQDLDSDVWWWCFGWSWWFSVQQRPWYQDNVIALAVELRKKLFYISWSWAIGHFKRQF
jgi:hypothetical protein